MESCLEEEWLADVCPGLDFVFVVAEWLADVCAALGFVFVVVVLADAAPGSSSNTAKMLANWNIRFPIDNDHLDDRPMNFRITPHCNEAVTERETGKAMPVSRNETAAAREIVLVSMPLRR